MRIANFKLWTVVSFVIAFAVTAQAQDASQKKSNKVTASQLVILSAASDRAHETLTIRGKGFGRHAPQVMVEEFSMTVMSATDTEIVAYLPAAVPDGTYLLTVNKGPSQAERDVFNFAVQSAKVVEGPMGPAGPEGPMGPAGPAGPMGPAGATGPAGPVGPQGETGATGAVGPQGPAGPQGEAGAVGPQGTAGPQGETGAMGATGAAGPQGPAGEQGPAGPQGATGAQGPSGPAGPQGPAGPEGPGGVSGIERVVGTIPAPSLGINGNGSLTGAVACPAGKRVLSGGFEATHFGSGNLVSSSSYPDTDASWRVTVRNTSVSAVTNVQFRVWAICANQ